MGHPAWRHHSRLDVRTARYHCLRFLPNQSLSGNMFTVMSLNVPTHHRITAQVLAIPSIPTIAPMKKPISPGMTVQ